MKRLQKTQKPVPEVGIDENKTNCNDSSINQPSVNQNDEGKEMKDCSFLAAPSEKNRCPLIQLIGKKMGRSDKWEENEDLLVKLLSDLLLERYPEEMKRIKPDLVENAASGGHSGLKKPKKAQKVRRIRVNGSASKSGIIMGNIIFNALNSKGEHLFSTTAPEVASLICKSFQYSNGDPFNVRTVKDAVEAGRRIGKGSNSCPEKLDVFCREIHKNTSRHGKSIF